MAEWLGAHLDTLLFIVVGVVCLVQARRVRSKSSGPESVLKEVRLLTFGGALLLLAGITRLLV
jgi:hypothetical protein